MRFHLNIEIALPAGRARIRQFE